jgi:hypothetical protein
MRIDRVCAKKGSGRIKNINARSGTTASKIKVIEIITHNIS